MQKLTAFTLSFISVTLVFYILISSQSIVVPFLIALAIAYLIISLAEGIRKVTVNGYRFPRYFAYFVAISMIVGTMYFVGTVLSGNVSSLIDSAPVYQQKLKAHIHWFYDLLDRPVPDFSKTFAEFDVASTVARVVLVLKDVAGGASLIGIYVIFILMEYHFFDQKVEAMIQSEKGKASAKKILKKIGSQIQSYLRIKTLISLFTALLSYTIMVLVGVDFAEFWAFSIFFLNYIPTIGSIIATIFPSLLTLLQFESWWPFAIVTTGLVTVQFVMGNFVEPRIMGKQFNLSGLVIILSLMIAGEVWGIVGMLLCVPLLVIISIILSNFSHTLPIAVLLSQTGQIEE